MLTVSLNVSFTAGNSLIDGSGIDCSMYFETSSSLTSDGSTFSGSEDFFTAGSSKSSSPSNSAKPSDIVSKLRLLLLFSVFTAGSTWDAILYARNLLINHLVFAVLGR